MGAEIKIRKQDGLTTKWGGSDLYVEVPTQLQQTTKCNGSLIAASNMNVQGILRHENASGAYVNGRNTVVKTATASASAELRSGAIYLPAGSLVRSITVVITTNLAWTGSKSLGVRAGNDATADVTFCAVVADSLYASATSAGATAGKGTSSDTILQADLSGNAALALSNLYAATATELHVAVKPNSGTITSGAVAFVVEFDYLGGN